MTQIHKSVALALMATYQQHIALAGNKQSQLTLGRHQVDLCIFADTLAEIIRYRIILIKLGVLEKDISYDYYGESVFRPEFHTISLSFEFD